MAKNQADRLTLQKRIRDVQEWILQDYATADIISQCINLWGVCDRQAYRYVWAANRFFQERDRLSIEKKRIMYIARLKKLVHDMDPKEKKTAAGVAAINRVFGSITKLEGVSVDTIKLIGDPSQPVRTVAEVAYSSPVDYSNLPTEFLEFLVNNRKTA